jgi:hypothetical protein
VSLFITWPELVAATGAPEGELIAEIRDNGIPLYARGPLDVPSPISWTHASWDAFKHDRTLRAGVLVRRADLIACGLLAPAPAPTASPAATAEPAAPVAPPAPAVEPALTLSADHLEDPNLKMQLEAKGPELRRKPRRGRPPENEDRAAPAPPTTSHVEQRYRERIAALEAAGERSKRDDDEQWAAAEFGPGWSGAIRELRPRVAPAEWQRRGRPTKSGK